MSPSSNPVSAEVAVIGSGLAGLTAAISLASSGKIKTVHLFEKQGVLGMMSNSNKASSGINGAGTQAQLAKGIHDTVASFVGDTLSAGKNVNDQGLVNELAESSGEAIKWLTEEGKLDLSQVAKLGGHSERRTHRVEKGAVGYSIIKSLTDKVKNEYADVIQVHVKSRVTKLLVSNGSGGGGDDGGDIITGLEYTEGDNTVPKVLEIANIVLATGGFSASKELISTYSPQTWEIPSSNGVGTTGDGIKLVEDLGVELIDMEYIQIHPTGFVDPQDRGSHHKILAGEVLRGIGGLLVNSEGQRFANEMATRDILSEKVILEQNKTGTITKSPIYLIIPTKIADSEIPSHLQFYEFKKLLHKTTVNDLFTVPAHASKFSEELAAINNRGVGKSDRFGRADFNKQVYSASSEFYVGEVTPVVHFCMGGIKINTWGQVLKKDKRKSLVPVRGLYAAGEVTGGVHGANRLGGSSLLECVVFGRKIAQAILSKVAKL